MMPFFLKQVLFWALLASVIFFLFALVRTIMLTMRSVGIQAAAEPYGQSPAEPTLAILVAGDSTAYGTGAATGTESVAGRIGADFPNASLLNLSKNGRKTGELLEVIEPLGDKRFDLVVLQIGGNDILRFTAPAKLEADIESVLKETDRIGRKTVLVTSGDVGEAPFFTKPFGYFWSQRTVLVRDIFQRAASRHGAAYVDLYGADVGDTMRRDTPRYYCGDLLHPSGDGYGIWYQHIGPAVRQALSPR